MAQPSDAEPQGKKRRIEDVLGEETGPTDSLETSTSSGTQAQSDTRSKDGNSSTSGTEAIAKSAAEAEVNAGGDHLPKKRRLENVQVANTDAESSTSQAVNLQAKDAAVTLDGERVVGSENDNLNQNAGPQQQDASESSKGQAPEDHAIPSVVTQGTTEAGKNPPIDATSAPPTSTDLTATIGNIQEDQPGSTEPPAKKARLSADSESPVDTNDPAGVPAEAEQPPAEPEALPKHSPLISLPTELLAEILIHTGSSQHVLAIARTCKYLCHLLLSPASQFIWRAARNGPGCTFEDAPPPPAPMAGVGWIMQAGVVVQVPLAPVPAEDDLLAPAKNFVKLPDLPSQFFSEATYAAFVFDSGKCDNCGKETPVMYNSFGLKARLCKNTSCKRPNNLAVCNDARLLSILPSNEMLSFTHQSHVHAPDPFTLWPFPAHLRPTQWVRESELVSAQNEFGFSHDDQTNKTKFELLQKRRAEWMTFCAALHKWKLLRQKQYYATKEINDKMGKKIASQHGWDYDLILDHSRYGPYKRRKTALIEEVSEADVNAMEEDIEAELLEYSAKAERRKAEINLMNNRKDVQGLYERLRSGKAHAYLPSLPTFRLLPVVSMLQTAESDKKSPSAVDALEKNPVMKELLNSQLKKWTENAKMDFGAILGFPKSWKHASKNVLHPVERVTARFVCTRCQRVDARYRADGCLDFIGACRHECGVGNQKKGRLRKGKKAIWDSKNFAKDDKAINVLKKTVALFKYAEDKDGGNILNKAGMAVVCTSCDPPMLLDTRTIAGHSHRHENMEVTLPTLDDVSTYLGSYPYEYGIVSKLLGPSGVSPEAKAEAEAKNFGCRHCLRAAQAAEAAAAVSSSSIVAGQTPVIAGATSATPIELASVVHRMHDNGIEGPLTKPPPLFNFHGIRSHLKAKHGIEDIRDEDILCRREVNVVVADNAQPKK